MKYQFFYWRSFAIKAVKKVYEFIKPINTLWSFIEKLYKVIKPLAKLLMTWFPIMVASALEFKKAMFLLMYA